MRKFVVAAVAAVVVGLGTAGNADAQLVYGYNNTFGGAYNSGGTFVTPGAIQQFNSSYSPFTGAVQRQVQYADVFGNRYGQAYGVSPFGYNRFSTGFYQPNPFYNPFGGYNYGFYNRRFPW
jgi:hypothetical protein